MDKIIYGAAYYAEYAPEERLEKDMRLIREAGMNTIRIAESTWSTHEPRCGEISFDHVTRVIETAADHGIDVIVGTPTYAIPKWLADMDPEILGSNKFGTRQNMDITNTTYRKYAERIIRRLLEATAHYENVTGFQIDNETKHYDVNNRHILDGFREWMRKRFHNDINACNDAYVLQHWSDSASSFEELPDPSGAVNGGYACAFEEYRRELAAEFLMWQSDIVRQYKRDDQFITHNLDFDWVHLGSPREQCGHSAGLQPGLNDYEAARALTLIGTDIYCRSGYDLTGWEAAYGGDMMRSLKPGSCMDKPAEANAASPYLVLESQSQAFTGWLPYPGQMKLMAVSHLASGACGMMYWPWASIHGGIESYWKGILDHDGEPGETYREASEIGKLFEKLSVHITQNEKTKQRAAMIVSPEALHALSWFPTAKDISYNDIVNQMHRALYELNIECDILYDRENDWSGYDLLIFPELYTASDGFIRRVREYVSAGGSILATFRSFFTDENLKIRHDAQPHGLTDVFGIRYSRFTRNRDHVWMDLAEPQGCDVMERIDDPHWGGYAAVTHNSFGEGDAWYLGCSIGGEALKKFLLTVCVESGIQTPEERWPLIRRQRGNLTFLMNYSDSEIETPVKTKCVDLISDAEYDDCSLLRLPAWGASVLSEHK